MINVTFIETMGGGGESWKKEVKAKKKKKIKKGKREGGEKSKESNFNHEVAILIVL